MRPLAAGGRGGGRGAEGQQTRRAGPVRRRTLPVEHRPVGRRPDTFLIDLALLKTFLIDFLML